MGFPLHTKLFDFQVNGFGGVDFQSESLTLDEMAVAVSGLQTHRMAVILFTLITDDVDALCRKFENIERIRARSDAVASVVQGYHLEGPWISREPGYRGAHPLDRIRAARLADYHRLRDAAGGRLKLITLAPEVDGALDIVEAARKDGIRISLGHTNATDGDINEAIKRGATLATHLGNGVPQEMHRHDNVVQRLLARDELIACFIPDGIHLPPPVLQNFVRAKPKGRFFFTTDCMAAAGAPPGAYQIGPHRVEVGSDGVVRMPGDRNFAGSSLTLDQGVENVANWLKLEAADVVEICSRSAAEHFGLDW